MKKRKSVVVEGPTDRFGVDTISWVEEELRRATAIEEGKRIAEAFDVPITLLFTKGDYRYWVEEAIAAFQEEESLQEYLDRKYMEKITPVMEPKPAQTVVEGWSFGFKVVEDPDMSPGTFRLHGIGAEPVVRESHSSYDGSRPAFFLNPSWMED